MARGIVRSQGRRAAQDRPGSLWRKALGSLAATALMLGGAGAAGTLFFSSTAGATAPAGKLAVTPAAQPFGPVVIGTVAAYTVSVANEGTFEVTGVSADVTGTSEFTITADSCTSYINAHTSCTISVAFAPTSVATVAATLKIHAHTTVTDVNESATVPLTGDGTSGVSISPPSLTFGSVGDGHTSAAKTFTITNSAGGGSHVKIDPITSNNPDFTVATAADCDGSGGLLPKTPTGEPSCTVKVTFTPSTLTAESGTVTIPITGGPTYHVAVTGTGVPNTSVTVTPKSLTFTTVAVHSDSTAKSVTFKNTGSNPLFIATSSITGTFVVTNNGCAFTAVQPGTSCTVDILFAPTATGARSSKATWNANVTGNGLTHLTVSLAGTGSTPASSVTATPALVFGTVGKTVTGPTMYIDVHNGGGGPVKVKTGGISTSNGDYSFTGATDTCTGKVVAAGGTCAIGVTFKPTKTGVDDGTVSIHIQTSSGTTTLATLETGLYGTGSASAKLTVAPAALTFATTAVGTTSAPKPVTVTNNGQVPVTFSTAPHIVGNTFVVATNTCPATLPVGTTCFVTAEFDPTVVSSSLSADLVFKDGAGTQSVTLSGASKVQTAALTVNPSPVDFGAVGLFGHSSAMKVTVTDTGTGPTTITSVDKTGFNENEFEITSLTTTCTGATLHPAGSGISSCTLTVTFFNEPTFTTFAGPQSAVLHFEHTGTTLAETVLTATVVNNTTATLTPPVVTFGTVPVGSASAAHAVTITNTGTRPLFVNRELTGITSTGFGPFHPVGSTCIDYGFTTTTFGPPFGIVLPGQSCNFDFVFAPTAAGNTQSAIFYTQGFFAGIFTALSTVLKGNGTSPTAGLTATPPYLTFGTVAKTVTGPTRFVTVTNHGTQKVKLGSVKTVSNGDYTVTFDTCATATVTPGDTCTVAESFRPTVINNDDGVLKIDTVATVPGLVVPLFGVGATGVKVVVSPTPLVFPTTQKGTTVGPKVVTVTNRGPAPLVFTATTPEKILGTSSFTLAGSTCPASPAGLTPTLSCAILVDFTPTTVSSNLDAVLTVKDTAGTQTVQLTGKSTASASALSVSPSPVNFGSVGDHHKSAAMTVTVTNTGSGSIKVTATTVSTTTTQFKKTATDCAGATLDAYGSGDDSCTIEVSFTPTGIIHDFGPQSAILNIKSGAATVVQDVLEGTTVPNTTATISPTPATFGTVPAGSAGAITPITIHNTGDNALFIFDGEISPTTTNFSIVGGSCDAPFTHVNPGQSCSFDIVFHPKTSGHTKSAQLTVFGDISGFGTVLSVTLKGNASTPTSTLSITPYVTFGTVAKTVSGPTEPVTIHNGGTRTVKIGVASITGGSTYTVTANACATRTLGPGASCQIAVNFTPHVIGDDDATLEVKVKTGVTTIATLESDLYGTGTGFAKVVVTPTSVTFGSTPVGTTKGPKVVTVTNRGTVPVTFTGTAHIVGNPQFHASTSTCTGSLAPTHSCYVLVSFSPAVPATSVTASLVVTDTAGSQSVSLDGSATANPGKLSVSPTTADFGPVGVGNHSAPMTVTLTNLSTNPITLSTVDQTSITGGISSQFHLVTTTCNDATLDAFGTGDDSCTTVLTFTPTTFGSHVGALQFKHGGTTVAESVLTGTGVSITTAHVSTTEVTFGTVIDPPSAPQPVTITNTGPGIMHVLTITQSGPDTATFTVVGNGCAGTPVAPGTSCTFYVVFTPGSVNHTISTVLVIYVNVAGATPATRTLTVLLKGNGSSPTAGLIATPPTLTFGTIDVGQTTDTQYVTVKNTAAQAVTLLTVTLTPPTGDYTVSADTCDTLPLGAGDTCTIGVSFRPSLVGDDDTTLKLNVKTGPYLDVPLFGIGSNNVHATVTPTSLTFGTKALNEVSGQQWVTLTNTGSAPLDIAGVKVNGVDNADFVVGDDTCLTPTPDLLQPGQSCVISVVFAPVTVSAALSADLDIYDGAGIQSVALAGASTASTSSVSVSPAPLNFGSVGINETSHKSVTITNTGNSKLHFTKTLTITGTTTFTGKADGCATVTLDTAASNVGNTTCTIIIAFTPTSLGAKTAIVELKQAGPTGSTTEFVVTGTGVAKTSATLTPAGWSFGTVPAGTVSAPKAFAVTDTGTSPLYVTTTLVTTKGADATVFTYTTDTCATVAVLPGQHCTIVVYFKPTAAVSDQTATLIVPGNFSTVGLTKLTAALSGNGTTPGMGLKAFPSHLTFGTLEVGVTSGITYVLIKNTGTQSVTIGTPGTPAGPYTVPSTNCKGLTLSPGATCLIGVQFLPTAVGTDDTTLTVPVNGGPALRVPLRGAGATDVAVKVTPSSLTFGTESKYHASAEKTVTVTNTGKTTLFITSVSTPKGADAGTFAITHTTCTGTTLAPNKTCSFAVVFDPSTVAPSLSADIDITDDAGIQTVTLSGKSTASTTSLTASPSPDTFGPVGVAQTRTSTIKVSNTGASSVTLGPIKKTGPDAAEFSVVGGNCSTTTLDAASSTVGNTTCTIVVTFTPSAFGPQAEVLDVAQHATGHTTAALAILLTGQGVATTSVSVTPTALTFGSVPAGTAVAAKKVTVTNTGTNPMEVATVKTKGANAGAFTVVNDSCSGVNLLPTLSCTIFVTFTAKTIGTKSAELAITGNFTGLSSTEALDVALGGTVTTPAQGLVATPAFLGFGTWQVGVTSGTTYVVVKNTGTTAVTIGSPSTPAGPYTVPSDTCKDLTLSAGAQCTIGVQFAPTSVGILDSQLTIPVTGGPGLIVPLYGTGATDLSVQITPTSLTFGSEPVGQATAEKNITVTNTGPATLYITTVTIHGEDGFTFAIVHTTCKLHTLLPGRSCQIGIAFLPTTVSGALSADVDIIDSAGTQSVALTGKSTASETDLQVTATPFGSVGIGDHETAPVTVTNIGSSDLKLGKAHLTGPDASEFTITGDGCSTTTLDTAASNVDNTTCTIQIVFTPDAYGRQTAVLKIPHNGAQAYTDVTLIGTGVASTSVSLSPTALTFGTVPVGDANVGHVAVTDTGSNPLYINAVTVMGKDGTRYTFVNTYCVGRTILPGESCTLFIVFTPTAVRSYSTARLVVNANVTGQTGTTDLIVPMNGTGTTPGIGLVATPPYLTFGTYGESVTSVVKYVTVKNTSDQAISLGTVTVDPSTDYTITTTNCTGLTLSPGDSCVFGVRFKPTVDGNDDAAVTVGVSGGPNLVVPLFGTGSSDLSLTVTPTSITFGSEGQTHASGEKIITVTNNSTATISINTVTRNGADLGDFAIEHTSCNTVTLQPSQSCTIGVIFDPTTVSADLSADITLFTSAGTEHVSLNGKSTASETKIMVTPAPVTFGKVGLKTSEPETVTVTDIGTKSVTLAKAAITSAPGTTAFKLTGDNCSGRTLDPPPATVTNTKCDMVVTYTPTKYGPQSAILEIGQATTTAVSDVILTGFGVGTTTAVITPATWSFGTVPAGSTSKAERFTVTDTGTNPLYVRTVDITGGSVTPTPSLDYHVLGDGCTNETLVPGQSCTVFVVFEPLTVTNNLDAVLQVHANVNGLSVGALEADLHGNGSTPGTGLVATPGDLDFGSIGLHVKSPTEKVTVKNTGTTAVKIGTVNVTGASATTFTVETNTCTSTVSKLAPGATCTVTVTFEPGALGVRDATLLIPTTPGKTLTVGLFGIGVPSTTLAISPSGTPGILTFPTTGLTHRSPEEFVDITNTGPNPLTIDGVTLTFLVTGLSPTTFTIVMTTCLANPVSPGSSCEIGLVFAPEVTVGLIQANLLITDNGPTSQQLVELQGQASTNANGAGYSVTPTKITFHTVGLTQPAYVTVVVTNDSHTTALKFGPTPGTLGTTVNYSFTATTCATATVAPQHTCVMEVVFDPKSLGSHHTHLKVAPLASSPTDVVITGVGVSQVNIPGLSLTPPNGGTLDFPNTLVGTTSAERTVTVKVTGPVALTVTKVTVVGLDASMFKVETTTCKGNAGLLEGASCYIVLAFTPSSLGQKTAQLEISDNASGSPQVVNLTGTGVSSTQVVVTPGTPGPGYDLVGSDGGVFVFPVGQTHGFYGSLPGLGVVPNKPIVGMVPTVGDLGYFLVGADGGVFAFGNAPFLGSLPGLHITPNQPITGIIAANTDKGYFLVGRDGGVFAFGTVPFLGSLPGRGITANNIIGIAAEPNGKGYWIISSTGTVYGFGTAMSLGTVHGTPSPVTAIAGTPTGQGYWVSTANGGVYAFGVAKKYNPGTLPAIHVTPVQPVIGIVHTPTTNGYWLLGQDGGIFAFGGAPFKGSLPGITVHVDNIVGAVPN